MALSERQKSTVMTALKAKIRGSCPMCAATTWTLHDEVVSSTTVSLGGGTTIGGKMVPLVQLVCNKCGFAPHHAVGLLGIDLSES